MGEVWTFRYSKATAPQLDIIRRSTPWYIIDKLSKVQHKDRILKTTKENVKSHLRKFLLCYNRFLSRNLQIGNGIFETYSKFRKKKICQHRILYPAKLSLMNQREIKSFQAKKILTELSIYRSAFQKMFKGVQHPEAKERELSSWKCPEV